MAPGRATGCEGEGQTMTTFTEPTVESATLAWLEAIGWQVAHGHDIAPSHHSVRRVESVTVMSTPRTPCRRPRAAELAHRLAEPRRFIQAVAGPRQAGKTTLVQQVTEGLACEVRHASADDPTLRGAEWIA